MKKILLLTVVPFLLVGCNSSTKSTSRKKKSSNGLNIPTAFRAENQIEPSKKGSPISYKDASEELKEIVQKMEEEQAIYVNSPEKFIEDADKFSYSFGVTVDDTYKLRSHVNYSQVDKYFSQLVEVKGNSTQYVGYESIKHYEYVKNDQFIVAFGNASSTEGTYKILPVEQYDTSAWFAQLANIILISGNAIKDIVNDTNMEAILEQDNSIPGLQMNFSSTGKGNLYIEYNFPAVGMYLQALVEDYWLTYEYEFVDIEKLVSYVEKETGQSIGYNYEYKQMAAELYIGFNKAEVVYPNLDNYTLIN